MHSNVGKAEYLGPECGGYDSTWVARGQLRGTPKLYFLVLNQPQLFQEKFGACSNLGIGPGYWSMP